MVIATIYYKLIDWQNTFIDDIKNSGNKIYEDFKELFENDIMIQKCESSEVVILPSKNELLKDYILKNTVTKDYGIIEYNFKLIEEELCENILPKIKRFNKNLKYVIYLYEYFQGNNNNIILKFNQKYKLKQLTGEEVELILVGNKNKIILSEEVQLLMGDKKYYDKEIWGFETKKIDDSNIDFQMSNLISSAEISHIHSLFKSFEKMEFMRVDGRIHEGQFYLIELSPDCYLGNDCAFYFAFNKLGYSFPEMFELLINNGLDHYRH